MARQGLLEASGAVIGRARMGEGSLWLTLLLKGHGLIRVSAPGAESGRVRFGGGTEPFVWGSFRLHRGRGGGLYLNEVDVADDMMGLRGRPEALYAAVRWSKLITRLLIQEHPDDGLLANLYWNMRLLSDHDVPAEVAGWRFLYRWLTNWGLAPDIVHCAGCGRVPLPEERLAWSGEGLVCRGCDPAAQKEKPVFTGAELSMLSQVAARDAGGVASMFREREHLSGGTGAFELASRCAEGLLVSQK